MEQFAICHARQWLNCHWTLSAEIIENEFLTVDESVMTVAAGAFGA